jgi:hypothetical protein
MKSRIGFLQKSLMVTGLILLLLGCAPEAASAPSPTNAEDETPEAVTATEVTRLSTETTTATASPTSTPNPPLTSAPTTTVMPVVTPTLIPTLAPEQAASVIHDLFEDNGGCLLPCFWGFTPGQTEWQTVQQLLMPIALQISLNDNYAEVRLPAPGNMDLIELSQAYLFEEGVITWIISPVIHTLNFQPSTILRTYGPPDEVWLLTANAPAEGYWRSSMTLFYPQRGFILQYGGDNMAQNGKVRGCGFEQDDIVLLGAWLPHEDLSYKAVAGQSVRFGETTFDLSLEEATGMSIAAFYETFKDPNNPICLESPLSLWPDP